MADLTANLKAPKPTAMQDHKTVTLGEALDVIDASAKGFITGLGLEWVSVTSINVRTGAAVLPGGGLVTVGADMTKTGISLGNNAWGHVYLYDNAGAAAVEVVTTAPLNYFGSAYQKTGDATRRYLGSVRTDGSSNVINFQHVLPDFIRYRANTLATPFLVPSNGTATSATDVNCSSIVPATSRLAKARLFNSSSTQAARLGSSDGLTPAAASGSTNVGALVDVPYDVELNSAQVFKYIYDAAPTNGLYADVYGYFFER